MAAGMNGVVYCGSMGDWPLLTDTQRQEGVKRLVDAGVRVIVGTGAQNTAAATAHAAHAQEVGADGLMVIPRVLSRGTSPTAQRNHFASILAAAPDIPAVIYNSPYYGFETKAPLFFDLRKELILKTPASNGRGRQDQDTDRGHEHGVTPFERAIEQAAIVNLAQPLEALCHLTLKFRPTHGEGVGFLVSRRTG